jgi:phenylacetate-CoA ligase
MTASMSDYYDALETRDPAVRARDQFNRLPAQIAHAKAAAPAFAEILDGVDERSVDGPAALSQLPVTRKSDLLALQKVRRPFGGFAATPLGQLGRVFGSPGPIYEPEARRQDYWRLARALFAAGFRRGDLVHNSFSYHFTPAGAMLESGAHALGCAVFPAGVGQTELQLQAIRDLAPRGYVGTPSFLKILLEKAIEGGAPVESLRKALVSGEALPASLRERIGEHGIDILQCYATADLGLIAYESEAQQGLIVDEGLVVEIVRPGSDDPVAEGEVGEVVVTTFNPDYPLIRFGTGDLSAVLPGTSPCGRTNLRIVGWLGRADQTTKVKGMFVHPSQVNEVVKRHPRILRARLVVGSEDDVDVMTLHCEVEEGDPELAREIAASVREVCKLRGDVLFTEPGALKNDGKVIDDTRNLE